MYGTGNDEIILNLLEVFAEIHSSITTNIIIHITSNTNIEIIALL